MKFRLSDRRVRLLAGAALASFLLGSFLAPPAGAVTLIRFDELPALVEESTRAVLAEVTAVHHAFDENGLHSTFVTLHVEDRLYGASAPEAGRTMEIKIYGAPVAIDGTRVFLDGTPRYGIGDRYLLLLIGESRAGFTNVAGLFQGAFRITEDASTRSMAESLAGNARVFGEAGLSRWIPAAGADASWLTVTDRAVPYDLVREAVVGIWTGLGRPLPPAAASGTGGAR